MESPDKKRLLWVDWMKSIGIYLIILGHFFTTGCIFIYTFSVPLFFIISGFLCKKEKDLRIFTRKLIFNLVIPMVLLSTVRFLLYSGLWVASGTFTIERIYQFLYGLLLGFHIGVGELWFVYTLICLKLICQFTPENKAVKILLLLAIPSCGVIINHCYPEFVSQSNAIVNATMAYPFFIGGFYLSHLKDRINRFNNPRLEQIGLLVCAAAIVICGLYNDGGVWMYCNGYGSNFLLFLIGGYAGTTGVFIISKWLSRIRNNRFLVQSITTISTGTIVILSLHMFLIQTIQGPLAIARSPLDFLYALLITVLFIPVIYFSEKHLPYIIGKYRIKNA